MSIEDLQGRTYERPFRADRSRVAAFIEATGDDAEHWGDGAPPSLAGAALFAVAPALLYDPDVGDFSNVLIHADQTFRWNRPWRMEEDYRVTGDVQRVRMRGGSAWVTFGVSVSDAAGIAVESASTFIMSDRRPDSDLPARAEPDPWTRAEEVRPDSYPADGPLPVTVRSASRHDLVRYAAASRDFNPLHWDNATARNAGLSGVVVHGLLMVSWLLQVASGCADAAGRRVAEGRFRFRNPLPAAEPATITGSATESGSVDLELSSETGPLVGGSVRLET